MKIFNVENRIKKVYVQMNDMSMLLRYSGVSIPASIFEKVFGDIIIVNDSNRMNFIEFTNQDEIAFFESLDWIVDYKEIRSLSEKEIKEKWQEIANEMHAIADKYNAMSDDEKNSNQLLVQKYNKLDYKVKYLAEILWVKQGYTQMPFPVVPDSDGFSFVGDEDCAYEIKASLDPNKILLFRKDGQALSQAEEIPIDFLQMGMSIAMMDRSEDNWFCGNYETTNYLTDDNHYLVTEFKTKPYEDTEQPKKETGIKKLIKRIFSR